MGEWLGEEEVIWVRNASRHVFETVAWQDSSMESSLERTVCSGFQSLFRPDARICLD